MLPQTPRGFRDVLPDEAAWRASINDDVQDCLASWGYMPIETPALEVLETMEAAGGVTAKPISLFDTDGRVLALRPDVTVPIARLVASRLSGEEGPFRFRYKETVFREEENLRAQAREVTQLGIESIGLVGTRADAEVVSIFVEALAACGLSDFTVAICSVDVLHALIAGACMDDAWERAVLSAYHTSNFVELEELSRAEGVADGFGEALRELPHLRGGREAIEGCRSMMAGLGCPQVPISLLETWDILEACGTTGHVVVDFSILTSFDYYTGLVIEAYAPGSGTALGSGGRYDTMLASYGRDLPAAGFAFSLERVMQALAEQGELLRKRTPDVVVGGPDPVSVFKLAAELRAGGDKVCITAEEDVAAEAMRLGSRRWCTVDAGDGRSWGGQMDE